MGFKVILTPQSLDDLREIVSFIAQDNSERARSFGNELIDRALTLAELPDRGRVVPELSDSSVREIVHRPYRIIYETFPEQKGRLRPALLAWRAWQTGSWAMSVSVAELRDSWWNAIALAMK